MCSRLQISLSSNYKTGAYPCMHAQRIIDSLLILRADGGNDSMDLPGYSDCPDRIIFMSFGHTEERHDSITHKLLDEAFILGDRLSDVPEDPAHVFFHFLGVEFFRHGSISGKIRKKDSNLFPSPPDRQSPSKLMATLDTELGTVRIHKLAFWALHEMSPSEIHCIRKALLELDPGQEYW